MTSTLAGGLNDVGCVTAEGIHDSHSVLSSASIAVPVADLEGDDRY